MREFIQAIAVSTASFLYFLGGQEIPWLNTGFKWLRRFVMPAVLLAACLYIGAVWYTAVLACALLCLATHLGYKNKVYLYFLTGFCMGAPSMFIAPVAAQVPYALAPGIVHGGFGLLSRISNKFEWSWVALITGMSIGIAFVHAAML